jgi:nucleotide-binding universal stress UspA family protein
MYRSLIVPLDGSPFAEHALPLALSIARRTGAALQLVHAHMPFVQVETGMAYDATLDLHLRDQEKSYLEGAANRVRAAAPVAVSVAMRDAPIGEAIAERAADANADLIVMTTHGHGPLSRVWLGSVADDLVRHAPVPVLLVRPQEKAVDLAHDCSVGHVLIALDGTPQAEAALDPALELGRLWQADYTVVRVVQPPLFAGHDPTVPVQPPTGQPIADRLRAEATRYIDGVAARLGGQGVQVQPRVVLDRQPAGGILAQGGDRPGTVIALATRGRGGLARALMGSVADKVIRGATTPVLVVPPRSQ